MLPSLEESVAPVSEPEPEVSSGPVGSALESEYGGSDSVKEAGSSVVRMLPFHC